MRAILIWLAAAVVLGNFAMMIVEKERLLRDGQTVYLALTPVDPRSFFQGDYMALNYGVMDVFNRDYPQGGELKAPHSGRVVIRLDEHKVGAFARIDKGSPLAPSEHWLKYHRDGWHAEIGAESYFIPEGAGKTYAKAAYAELKLEPDGTPLIVALCDRDLHRIVAQHDATQ